MDTLQVITGIVSDLMRVGSYVCICIGSWFLFKKCGVKRIWALIPVAREYQISLCADKESDGRVYAIFSALYYITSIPMTLIVSNRLLVMVLAVIALTCILVRVIYMARIYLGLIGVFRNSRKWILGFLFFEGLTLFYWGMSKKFVPTRKVTDSASSREARVSGQAAETIAEGLTVNIRSRTVIDFFRKRYLLKDIHMTIPKGHMVLLLGGSGAGKTTYVNAITGYEKADASILLDTQDVYRDYEKMQYDVGFVPQQDLMRGNDTVWLTLADAATLRLPASVKAKQRRKRVNEVLEEFGLATVRNSLVEKLSGGQRKRLSIAMEYISDPTLFILDEPDSGLDGVVARGLFEKLRAIADEGKIVVVITHTPDRVIDLFDDVIVLAKDDTRCGRLAYYGPVKDAYPFFGKDSMESILLSINQKDEGGEGRATEFVEKYGEEISRKAG